MKTDLAENLSRKPLLDWYDAHRRVLPWRVLPGQKADPYHVWLSEIMLQQTTVATVRDYFTRFLARWPTIQDLAAAPLDDVLAAWAGLGYYARARNLHKCAKAVVAGYQGRFPSDEAELLKLPGIGSYTAAAIAAIAFDLPATVIDGNVDRVITRLAALSVPIRDNKAVIRALADDLFHRIENPAQPRSGDFAQAMMDLGAMICTPTNPACLSCPWQDCCRARALGMAETLPVKSVKKLLPRRYGLHMIAVHNDALLMERRPPKGLLGGMLGLPGTDWQDRLPDITDLAMTAGGASLRMIPGDVQHRFTHFDLIARLAITDSPPEANAGQEWVPLDKCNQSAIPTVFAKMIRHFLESASVKRQKS